jgi:hypothetical protein
VPLRALYDGVSPRPFKGQKKATLTQSWRRVSIEQFDRMVETISSVAAGSAGRIGSGLACTLENAADAVEQRCRPSHLHPEGLLTALER